MALEVFGALVALTMARYNELLPCLLCMCALTTASVWLAMSEGSEPDGAVTRPGMSMRSRNGTSGVEMWRMMGRLPSIERGSE